MHSQQSLATILNLGTHVIETIYIDIKITSAFYAMKVINVLLIAILISNYNLREIVCNLTIYITWISSTYLIDLRLRTSLLEA